ncbi:S-layer family protein [Nodularia sp. UHCC 0506]|uniref:S-layer family protein n=1 Tax=Nodularia sp. UHCC 0506 TaxID=3110243 RepID=UPI002B1EFE4F|nr:S-layer family protein [Nodularia sp. UHCC 0506]MEA5513415.1 S-layer family protein [Nodularia sp. UHCC 0506]
MKFHFVGFCFLGAICISAIYNNSVHAQITPDNTLNSTVSGSNNYTITNGIHVGNNLFHSFNQFSIPTGSSVLFNNATSIENIFARVTGGNISNIDGTISSQGSANLFLLNPAGILFGANAKLSIGGSFVGTTADSIVFADELKFSTTNTTSPALLTMSVPVGLQLGNNAGAITVQGAGHNGSVSTTSQVSGLNKGLELQSGKTLALVGGNIALDGGLVSAPGGQIELGSISNANVTLNSTAQGFTLSYPNIGNFGNITLSNLALVSTDDINLVNQGNSGAIHIQGKQISIHDGSLVLIQNRSNQAAGDIVVNATDSLHIIGKSPNFRSSSSLINDTISSEAAGNIIVNTPKLNINQGGYIINRTFSNASGGNIIINSDTIDVSGLTLNVNELTPNFFAFLGAVSQITAGSFSTGKGGDISISTQNLSVSAGANITARPLSSGNGGDVNIKADTIQVLGAGAPRGGYYSIISAPSLGAGDAGNLNIDTRKLSVQGGGRVSTSGIILGNAGSLTINASESIDVSGMKPGETPSYIGSAFVPVFNTNSRASAGNTVINAPIVNVSDDATIFVQNTGSGTAGNLIINTNTLTLKNGGNLLANTRAGEGGNINLQLRDVLLMRQDSFINAEAGSNGNGGNININSPNVIGLENSDIIANAVQGNGGNIQITTQGIIGLEYRNLLNPREVLSNDITASSQFSVSGTVQINNVGIDPNSGLIDLPTHFSDSSQQIATGCSNINTDGSSFITTGRGGIPQNPTQEVRSDRTWSDIRDISAFQTTPQIQAQTPTQPQMLVQATGWGRNANGKIELRVAPSPAHLPSYLTCAAASQN